MFSRPIEQLQMGPQVGGLAQYLQHASLPVLVIVLGAFFPFLVLALDLAGCGATPEDVVGQGSYPCYHGDEGAYC